MVSLCPIWARLRPAVRNQKLAVSRARWAKSRNTPFGWFLPLVLVLVWVAFYPHLCGHRPPRKRARRSSRQENYHLHQLPLFLRPSHVAPAHLPFLASSSCPSLHPPIVSIPRCLRHRNTTSCEHNGWCSSFCRVAWRGTLQNPQNLAATWAGGVFGVGDRGSAGSLAAHVTWFANFHFDQPTHNPQLYLG